LSHLVHCKFKMLEIGVLDGASLRMWEEFFPLADIFAIDVDAACAAHASARATISIVEQGDKTALQTYAAERRFSLIIDDGGHRMKQQILSFEVLFPTLLPGGTYVIEDSHTSYIGLYGGGIDKKLTTVKYFHAMTDDLNRGLDITGTFIKQANMAVASIEFIRGLIIISKI